MILYCAWSSFLVPRQVHYNKQFFLLLWPLWRQPSLKQVWQMKGAGSATDIPGKKLMQLKTYNNAGGSIEQRSICHVGVTRDPANVSCTPVNIIGLVVKDVLERCSRVQHVAPHWMQHTFRLACGTTGMQQHKNYRCGQRWIIICHCHVATYPRHPFLCARTPLGLPIQPLERHGLRTIVVKGVS